MSLKLMIVDDSSIIRRKIDRINNRMFDVVASASDGEDAIKLYEKHKPDVITMDLTMPNMDGVECIKHLSSTSTSKLLILVVSALNDKATAIQAIKAGANGFLCKPFTDEQLRCALKKITGGQKHECKRH